MPRPSNRFVSQLITSSVIAIALAASGCIWEYSEDCDDEYDDCFCEECDYGGDQESDSSQDTDDEGASPESYWEEHVCDEIDPEDPCQEAICQAIGGYLEALEICVEVEEECDCNFLEECLVVFIECIDGSCVDQDNHDVGGMIDCSLQFAACIDPC